MKRICVILIAAFTAGMLVLPSAARAFGVGAYVTGGYGSYKWDISPSTMLRDYNVKTELKSRQAPLMLGTGVMIDSSLADESIVNVRFKLGYQYARSPAIRQDGFGTNLIVGFAPYRSEKLRYWLGPVFLIDYYNGKGTKKQYAALYVGFGPVYGPFSYRWNFHTAYLGAGLATGLNFNLAKRFTLTLELAGTVAKGFGTSRDLRSSKEGCGNWGFEGTVTIGFLYRVI